MVRLMTAFTVVLITSTGCLFAKPVIEFDTKEFQCGTVMEGKVDRLDAVFVVKNSGDEPLILSSVRPSCGCTIVKYDSIIQPGATIKISSTVKIRGYRAGHLAKAITVTSNAPNDSIARLTIKATIQAAIDVSTNFIDMTGDKGKSPATIQITSLKNNLKVTAISFTPSGEPGKSPLKEMPITVKYSFNPMESPLPGDLKAYRLDIEPPAVDSVISGLFNISTNHPDKQEISIRGRVGI